MRCDREGARRLEGGKCWTVLAHCGHVQLSNSSLLTMRFARELSLSLGDRVVAHLSHPEEGVQPENRAV